jgi:hypothetical protein
MAGRSIFHRAENSLGVGVPLTQTLSDEFGWRDLEKKVAAMFHQLSV